MAIVCLQGALVEICTSQTITATSKTSQTLAGERANGIGTLGVSITVISFQCALIDIRAVDTISRVANGA
jgi:hypothetical protein